MCIEMPKVMKANMLQIKFFDQIRKTMAVCSRVDRVPVRAAKTRSGSVTSAVGLASPLYRDNSFGAEGGTRTYGIATTGF
jgi:hypothetical protein